LLNPREQAILIWFVILILYALSQKNVRSTIPPLIKSLLKLMCHPIFMITIIYIVTIFLVMYLGRIIKVNIVKDYIVWIFSALFPLIHKVATEYSEISTRKIFFKTFKFSVIPLFIVNEYTLSIWAEIFIVPILFLIGALLVIAETDEKYEPVKKILNTLLIIIGLIFLTTAIKGFLANLHDASKIEFWLKMCIDFIGITLHIPLLILIKALSFGEQILIRTNITSRLDKIRAVIFIIYKCKLSKQLLLRILKSYEIRQINTIQDLKDALQRGF